MGSPLFQKFVIIISISFCIVLLNLSYYQCNTPPYPYNNAMGLGPKQNADHSEIEFYTPRPILKPTQKQQPPAPSEKQGSGAIPLCRKGKDYYHEDKNSSKSNNDDEDDSLDEGRNQGNAEEDILNEVEEGDIDLKGERHVSKRKRSRRKQSDTSDPSLRDPEDFLEKLLINSTENTDLPIFLRKHIWAPKTISQYSACPTPINLRRVRSCPAADWFSDYVEDITRCYCGAWSFFRQYNDEFYGESGFDYFRETINRIRSEFRGSSMNVFANLAPRSKYSIDMLESYTKQLYVNVGSNPSRILKFFQTIEPSGKKFLFFEPVSEKQEEIRRLMANETRLNLVPLALAESPGKISLDLFQFHSYKDKIIVPKVNKGIFVNVTTLDSYLLQENMQHIPISILSIDTEGFDVSILKGAKETLTRVRMIMFECHRMMRSSVRHSPGGSHFEVQDLLAEYGFMVFKISKRQWIPFTGHLYHTDIDTPSLMGWQKCVALRYDDSFIDRVWPYFNALKACQHKPLDVTTKK